MESDQESQAPAAPGPLPPPGAQPPPATDAGYLELLGVLRLRARGLAPWMLPRYFLFNVDVYDFHPQELLETYPAATAADGSSAIYFVNPVRAKTATDYRKRRSVPGGAWKSERAPVPLVSGAIEGTRQTFSFTVNGPKGKKCRPGFIMQEITLAGDEGALEGGDELAVSKIYRSPHGEKDADANSSNKRKIGAGTASYRAQQSVANSGKKRKIGARAASYRAPAQQAVAAASSSSNAVSIPAPALRLGSCNLAHQAASFFPAPALRLGSSSPAHQPPSPARPLRLGVSTSSAPPLGQSAVSTSSSPPLRQAAASLSSSQGRRFLVLEVANFPLMEGENFSKHIIYRASEVVGATRKTIDCDDLLVFQKKRLQTKADNYTGDISFTYEELNAATLGFPRDHFLGEGRFEKVYKGVLDGNEVAIKVLNPHGLQGNREFCTEAMVLSRMHHSNLVKLVGFCADDDQRLLVYEYMPLGSLETHIFDLSPDKKPLDWNTRMKILAGAAQGLKYLHVNCNPPMIHCDVKCANILLGEGYHPKLSDFGLAKLGPTGDNTHVSTRVMGTPGYCAPEYLEGGQLTIKSDVYSFGVVILEVITGRKALGQSRIRAERSLAEWATPLIRRKDFAMFADPALGNQYSMTSLFQVLSVARMCLNTSANLRPHMTDVAAALAHISMPAATNL